VLAAGLASKACCCSAAFFKSTRFEVRLFLRHPIKNAIYVLTCNRIDRKIFFTFKCFFNVLPGSFRENIGRGVGAGEFKEDSYGRVLFSCHDRPYSSSYHSFGESYVGSVCRDLLYSVLFLSWVIRGSYTT
jgi:hypothetical protein